MDRALLNKFKNSLLELAKNLGANKIGESIAACLNVSFEPNHLLPSEIVASVEMGIMDKTQYDMDKDAVVMM